MRASSARWTSARRADGVAGTADRDQRDPARHQQLADRYAAGVRCDSRKRVAPVRLAPWPAWVVRRGKVPAPSRNAAETMSTLNGICGSRLSASPVTGDRAHGRRAPALPYSGLGGVARYRDRVEAVVERSRSGGHGSVLAVPMLKEGRVVGGILIYRPEVRPFTQKQIDLVSTFANQAVIAIENVRLFKGETEGGARAADAQPARSCASSVVRRPTSTGIRRVASRSAAVRCAGCAHVPTR